MYGRRRGRLSHTSPPHFLPIFIFCDFSFLGNEGIVSGQKSNRKGVIRLNTIKDIIEKVHNKLHGFINIIYARCFTKHCVLQRHSPACVNIVDRYLRLTNKPAF